MGGLRLSSRCVAERQRPPVPGGDANTKPAGISLPFDPRHTVARILATPSEPTPTSGRKSSTLDGQPPQASADFVHGVPVVRGETAEEVMNALRTETCGLEPLRRSRAERIYDSVVREPLGRSYVRGHLFPVPAEGFGKKSGASEDTKSVLYPVGAPLGAGGGKLLPVHRRSNSSLGPGEQLQRAYRWPEGSQDRDFRFGVASVHELDSVRRAVSPDEEPNGLWKTRVEPRAGNDYRQRSKSAVGKSSSRHAAAPPRPRGHVYGRASQYDKHGVAGCLCYSPPEQLHDLDLAQSMANRRGLAAGSRPSGVPSVRSDLAPPLQRSFHCTTDFGDEGSAGAVICPSRFAELGLEEEEFAIRRTREELWSLVCGEGSGLDVDEELFNELWREASGGNDAGSSLNALLHAYSHHVDEELARQMPLLRPAWLAPVVSAW
eukprot:NODE_293_length_1696_cov_241.876904.p1 GENE.NODE_293_length_1696_cov_241.876904~~NODE_293_length_1696_cov_241.876904.p1  ORF type:complete len:434 (+),score=74.44 NODE_293_length_1696_cov_241.876904:3-1304(+)